VTTAPPPAIAPLDMARLRFDCFVQTAGFSKVSTAANPVGDAVGIRPPPVGLSMAERLALTDQLVTWCLA
jgi:hypothetical protein